MTENTLFLVTLATANRIGELQVLSRIVSSVVGDLVEPYRPHFLAEAERAATALSRSFCVRSLRDYVGDL